MRVVWKIYARDMRRAVSNFAMIVLVIALIVLPGLYAWFNIAAAMNPYDHTDQLAVAVANDDRPATLSLGGKTTRLDAGSNIISELKKNHQLGWRFMSKSQALQQVRSGESYAAIIIPSDFSSTLVDLAHFTDPHAHLSHPTLQYYVNEKISGIAPKITDTGSTTLDRTINETVIKTASKAVVTQLRTKGADLTKQADSTADSSSHSVLAAAQSVGDVRASLADLSDSLTKAASATKRASTHLADISQRAQRLSGTVQNVHDEIPDSERTVIRISSQLPATIGTATSAIMRASSSATGTATSATNTLSDVVATAGTALTDAQTAVSRAQSLVTDLQESERQLRAEGQTRAADILHDLIAPLQTHTAHTQQLVDSLNTSHQQAQKGVDDARNLTQTLSTSVAGSVQSAATSANTVTSITSSAALDALTSIATATQSTSDSLTTVTTALKQARDTLGTLQSTLSRLSGTVGTTNSDLERVQRSLETTATDIAALTSSQNAAQLRRLLSFNASSVADFIAVPTRIVTRIVFPVSQYGAALTPLYSNVALWMGSLMLVIMIRMEVDATGLGVHPRRWQAYLGRYMLIGTLAVLQGLVITAGDLATGIKVVNIPAFLFSGMVQGFVYSAIIYALTICLQQVGKAIAILFIIMQIPGATGIYPIEMMPKFYQDINPWLPWTYGISMMREAIGGMYRLTYGHDLLILLVFSAIAFFLGVWLRGYFVNLNLLMDERLAQTEFFDSEKGSDLPRPRVRLTTMVRSLIGTPAWRERVLRRAVRFDKAYPKLIRAAFAVTILVPFIPFALIASPNEKLVSMGIWVTVMLIAVSFVIIVEYVHRSLTREVGLSRLSTKDLQDLMSEKEGER